VALALGHKGPPTVEWPIPYRRGARSVQSSLPP
jgi:hypothetical protein